MVVIVEWPLDGHMPAIMVVLFFCFLFLFFCFVLFFFFCFKSSTNFFYTIIRFGGFGC